MSDIDGVTITESQAAPSDVNQGAQVLQIFDAQCTKVS